MDSPFSIIEVNTAIKKLKLNKAPGGDGIPNEFIKFGGENLSNCLTTLFNKIKKREMIPSIWNKGKISLIHKGGSRHALDNYRGITLTCSASKLFSSILKDRMERVVEGENLLGETQNGFRPGRSTEDNLLLVRQIIDHCKSKKKKCYLAFIDLKKAFDRVRRDILWEVLKKANFSNHVINLIKALYQNTQQSVNLRWGETDWFTSNIGLKQGCVLSPLLFSLYITEVSKNILDTGVGIRLHGVRLPTLFFADDMLLASESKDDMRKILRVLSRALATIKLDLNAKKSNILTISGDRNEKFYWTSLNNSPSILEELSQTDNYKYLGILISNKQNPFKMHLDKIIFKAKQLGAAICAKAANSFDKIKVGYSLWCNMACPAIPYGCEAIKFDAHTYSQLEIAQNNMGRWLLGARRFCSTAAIRRELGWKSMKSRIYEAKLKYWGKVCFTDEGRLTKLSILDSIKSDWSSKWLDEINFIKREIDMQDMINTKSYKDWHRRVENSIRKWEDKNWDFSKKEIESRVS